MRIHRRNFLQVGAGVVLACTTSHWMQKPQKAIASTKASVKIGYLPLAAGLPLYLALEKGYFKQAGLDVEAVKLSGEQQVVKELMAGRIQGAANGVDSSDLAIGEIASPGLFKIIASNTIGGTLNSPGLVVRQQSAPSYVKKIQKQPKSILTFIAARLLAFGRILRKHVSTSKVTQNLRAILLRLLPYLSTDSITSSQP